MITDYKKYDLFGKALIEIFELEAPFHFVRPIADNACFIYMMKGDMQYQMDEEQIEVPTKHSLLLNCIDIAVPLSNQKFNGNNEVVIIHFHPDVLKKIYDRELPILLKPQQSTISNKAIEQINNDFLIQKYIEGLLFYFENPSLVNEDILVLKLKEIILLLLQTQNAEAVKLILSRLYSRVTYSFKQTVEAHLFSPITVEELAQHNNLSVSSFKREFAKLYHDTPANYIKHKRLEKAAELLTISDARITDIAYDCGFNDLANFTKSFNSKFHLTPSQYRLNQIAK